MTDDWRTLPLGQALTFQRGFDITKNEQRDGPYPVISSSGPKTTHAEFKIRGPGVVIGRKGSLGTVFYSHMDYWPHDTTLWVRDFHGNCPRFAYYLLQTMDFQRLDAGASNPSLNRNHIHTIPVRLPPPPIQQRIAGILSAYDELIENNQRRIRILEEMARALYREWFVNFRFPGHEKVKLVPSPLGNIPQGWEVMDVKDLLARRPSGNVYRQSNLELDEGIPIIDQSTNELLGFHANEADHSATPDHPIGIFGDHTCKMQLLFKPFSIGPNVIAFQAAIDRPLLYLFYLVSALVHTQEYKRHWSLLVTKQVVVADQSVAQQFRASVQPLMQLGELLQSRSRILRKTHDLLLPRLLSGQINLEEN